MPSPNETGGSLGRTSAYRQRVRGRLCKALRESDFAASRKSYRASSGFPQVHKCCSIEGSYFFPQAEHSSSRIFEVFVITEKSNTGLFGALDGGSGCQALRLHTPFQVTMNVMAVKLIALDIDGTLLDSRWQVSDANRAAIAEAARRGIEVALVTGRRYDFAMPVARNLNAPLTMIVNNGALIRSKEGHTHLRHLLDRDVAERVLLLTKRWRESAAVIFDRPLQNQVILESLDPDDSLRYAYYQRNKEYIGLAKPLESCLTEDPIQVMFSGRVASIRDAEKVLRGGEFSAEFALAVTSYESKDFSMIDVINPICSKGSSLAEWAAVRGLARGEVMAIGDNHNDLEMLTFAGIPVVMGNGVPELKKFGWHETSSNDENGVAHAIEQFVLREAAPCA